MKINVLDVSGHTVLTDTTTEGIENVKKMTSTEIKKEFNRLIKEGYTPINDTTHEVMKSFDPKAEEVTMIYPLIGG